MFGQHPSYSGIYGVDKLDREFSLELVKLPLEVSDTPTLLCDIQDELG